MAVKSKISKSKRNNQKRNKLVKRGVIKKSSKPAHQNKNESQPKPVQPPQPEFEEDSDIGEDMLQMVEEDDIDFLKSAITKRSYKIFDQIKYSGPSKSKKAKLHENRLETEYEANIEEETIKYKNLLPIKTDKGIVFQKVIDDSVEEEPDYYEEKKNETNCEIEEGENEGGDDGEFTLENNELDVSKPIPAAHLLITRNNILRQRKVHIGTLSAGVLENPEEKVTNIRTLLSFMDDSTPEVYFTVRKLTIVSLLEVFKDVLPSYQIRHHNEGVKMKKDTFKLQKFETTLLQYYKKFLQKLEKYSLFLCKKKGDTRIRTEEEKKLGELTVHTMSDLLVTHPYFNFGENIARAVIPFLNHPNPNVRGIVKLAVQTVFKEDKKEEITLKILIIINQHLRKHSHNVHIEMLEVLLVLNLRDVNLDMEKEQDIKQKKLMSHKQNILQMSKKERKRKKKLKDLEQELLETKAEENKQLKQKNVTEITKIMFGIYFRILKSSTNTKVLGVCLEGLAKFAHCINMDYYVDLVNVLDNLLNEDWLGYREQLHCIQTVFAILSGQGEALNLDPTRFYNSLYKDLLVTNASKNHNYFSIVLRTLSDSLVKRRKKITIKRTIGFMKRLATLSLQLLHNGTLGTLGIIRNIMQLNKSVDILLDLDITSGDGKYNPELNDPEYSNATSSALYEMIILNKHYNPIVSKYAKNIAYGAPTSGEGSLPFELGKCFPDQLFDSYSMNEMAFNPPVPVPKKVQPKTKVKELTFYDSKFEDYCKIIMKSRIEGDIFCT